MVATLKRVYPHSGNVALNRVFPYRDGGGGRNGDEKMATTTQIYSVSQVTAIKAYIAALTITNGVYIKQILDEIYIIDW